jgi:hypothetical protein
MEISINYKHPQCLFQTLSRFSQQICRLQSADLLTKVGNIADYSRNVSMQPQILLLKPFKMALWRSSINTINSMKIILR